MEKSSITMPYAHISLLMGLLCTSPQNGKTERILCTLNDCVRSLLLHTGMPPSFCVEALSTTTHLVNRQPYQASGSLTPFQLLLGAPPSYDHLRVFGYLCYLNQAAVAPHKLSARSTACVLLGYPSDHRGYRYFDLQSCRVITSRHAVFNETQFPFCSSSSESSSSL